MGTPVIVVNGLMVDKQTKVVKGWLPVAKWAGLVPIVVGLVPGCNGLVTVGVICGCVSLVSG